jgi:NADH:ubiquinone oxidoreductase subunit E
LKEIKICIGSACHVRGSYDVVQQFKKRVEDGGLSDEVELVGSFCMNACSDGVTVKYKDRMFSVKPGEADAVFDEIMGMD